MAEPKNLVEETERESLAQIAFELQQLRRMLTWFFLVFLLLGFLAAAVG